MTFSHCPRAELQTTWQLGLQKTQLLSTTPRVFWCSTKVGLTFPLILALRVGLNLLRVSNLSKRAVVPGVASHQGKTSAPMTNAPYRCNPWLTNCEAHSRATAGLGTLRIFSRGHMKRKECLPPLCACFWLKKKAKRTRNFLDVSR